MLLRPKTGLKDMNIEMDPGTEVRRRAARGGTIPVSNTLPDVNLDEMLSSLDSDTRAYLQILINAGGEAFGTKGYPADLRETSSASSPPTEYIAKITACSRSAARNLRHVIHNFRC